MSNKQTIHWPDNTVYFLTGSTFLHYPYFREDDQKLILLNQFKKIQKELNAPISAYSIAINHYHLKLFLKFGSIMTKVKQILHGGTSYIYRQRYKRKYDDLWKSRKVLQVCTEEVDHKVSGYIIGNLLKHKEVSTFNELYVNQFSSYKYFVNKYGVEYAKELVRSVININEDVEGSVDLVDFENISTVKVDR